MCYDFRHGIHIDLGQLQYFVAVLDHDLVLQTQTGRMLYVQERLLCVLVVRTHDHVNAVLQQGDQVLEDFDVEKRAIVQIETQLIQSVVAFYQGVEFHAALPKLKTHMRTGNVLLL